MRSIAAAVMLMVPVAVVTSVAVPEVAEAAHCTPPMANEIACENSKPGNPPSEWDVSGAGDSSIQGFATDISVDQGGTVGFKVDTVASSFRLDIYRMGYYGGDGARLIDTIFPTDVRSQPSCLNDPTTGLVDCGNWIESASWNVPADAVSGIYFAKLVRTDGPSGASHVVFIVRDDDGGSDLLFQTADTTWQAYNEYGGNSLYVGSPVGRAYKVSYNRPFTTRQYAPEDWVFNAEYPMVRFLERNGYDVSYTTNIDADRLGAELLEHDAFLSVGHDEYWSGDQRANVEAARDAGVNLAFFSGNEVYWKTRWENSIDGSGTPYRTLVSYKETESGGIIDPAHPIWTGTWRDLRFSPPADGGPPENALTGTMFRVNCCAIDMEVTAADGAMRFWRDTRVADLTGGQTTTVGSDIVGYEWDEDADNGFRPAGLFRVSETYGGTQQILLDEGAQFGNGEATHAMTMYRAPSGALVFGAGTVQWSWGLDDDHDRGPSGTSDVAAQQATVNLFADMGVQPASLMPGLVQATQSTDTTAPTSTITSPADGSGIPPSSAVVVTGTATDVGGQVGGIEVSIDGGTTWSRADGRDNWSYTFTAPTSGTVNVQSRSVDDSGNIETPSAGIDLVVGGSVVCPCSIWPFTATPDRADADTNSVEVGVKFQSSDNGEITGLRFYKYADNTGTHVGNLWTSSGTLLGSVTFTNETASGWQQADFASPIPVTAGTTYVASYFAPNGRYGVSSNYFAGGGVTNGPLTALANGVDGGNGVYAYGSTPGQFPNNTFQTENYWVDVVFDLGGPDTTPPTVVSSVPADGATGASVSAPVSVTFSEPVDELSVQMSLSPTGGSAVAATTGYDAGSRTMTLTPTVPLDYETGYTIDVSGATDGSGNTMTPTSSTFTTGQQGGGLGCPCTIWPSSAVPDRADADTNSVEVGVKFRADTDGFITGIRFYKFAVNTGTHVGHIWTSTGTQLGSATFTNETASGWQEATFSSPISVTAGTTYVASYFAPNGRYSVNSNFFAGGGVTNGPLTALANGVDGGNGVYAYGPTPGQFPNNSFQTENYWVDVVYDTSATDTTPPSITTRSPAVGATGVSSVAAVTVTFSEPVDGGSVVIDVSPTGGSAVAGTTSYDAPSRTATFSATDPFADNTEYTVDVSGATDAASNTMAPASWTFTTAGPPPPLPSEGPGGSIGVVTSGVDAFSGYFAEILRNEGLNQFETFDVADLDLAKLNTFTTVIVGPVPLSTGQVADLTTWVNNGGNLIASRPDSKLDSLLGLTSAGGTLSEGYLLIDGATEAGAGVVNETIQFHGTADQYNLNGATAIATLYSTASASTPYPAVTTNSVGANGGQAMAFTYDLARSVVLTRQGNPAWVGQDRDAGITGDGLIRSDDLYFGGSETDWVDLDKVGIPQADEQQRLLANLIEVANRDRFPLPRFWYFPDEHEAVVIATGDDHANGGTAQRFDTYLAADAPGCSVADWECNRFTSYIYPETPLSNAAAAGYEAQGFEVALHPENGCANFTSTQNLRNTYTSELADFAAAYPSVPAPTTNRFHCLIWSDWDSQAIVQYENGIRFDTNYYYWPGGWVLDRPGFMTGSGMPQRFARTDGTMIDVYQGATQMTDESGQSYPFNPDTLLDRAQGPEKYYGYFVANMHTDVGNKQEDTALLDSANQRGVPVVTARSVLEFLDGRNQSSFANVGWAGEQLSFDIVIGSGANNLTSMVPMVGPGGRTLQTITRGATPVTFQTRNIKGLDYAVFPAVAGSHVAAYSTSDITAPTVVDQSPTDGATGVAVSSVVTVTFSEPVIPATVSMSVTPAGGSAVAGSTSYDAGTRTMTFTPSAPLDNDTVYTVDVSGAQDAAGNTMAPVSWSFATEVVGGTGCPCSIWPSSTVPPITASSDTAAIEVGLKFQADQDGEISGVRFYKGTTNTGTHVGNLWSATGTNLGSVTFTNESASGWQEALFASPVAVTAGTTYVVSYHAPNGRYALESNGLATAVVNGPLTAVASGGSGGNGVYLYGAGGFPTNSFNASNYWVDVVFQPSGPDTTPPTVTGQTPADGAVDVSTASLVSVTFSEPVVEATVSMTVTPAGGSAIAGSTSYDAPSQTMTFTPLSLLANSTDYTVDVSGAQDPSGNTMAPVSWSFTTQAGDVTPPTVTGQTPADGAVDVSIGSVATATFSESVVEATVAMTVTPAGGSAIAGSTSYDAGTRTMTFTPSLALAIDTVYTVDVSGAQDPSGNTMAPVSWSFTTEAGDVTAPTVTGQSPADGAVDVATSSGVTATFSESVVEATVSMTVTPAGGSAIAGSTSYDAPSRTMTFTPSSALANDTVYTVDVSGAQDSSGNTMVPVSWSFTTVTAGGTGCPCTIFGSTVPPIESSPDSAVELGLKFQVDQNGEIAGVRFYKGAGNTGTHVGNLWTAGGTNLGTVTFTGETATGWQEASFASPIAVTAGTTYVVSYHAPNGGYALEGNGLSSAIVNGPVTALASGSSGGNGVYAYGSGGFPSNTFNASNYFVDVVFSPGGAPDTTPPTVTGQSPADGAVGVATSSVVTASFSESVVEATVSMTVTPAGGSAIAGSTSYNAGTRTMTFTPSSALANDTVYTVDVSGAQDPSGNTMVPVSWSFTTVAAGGTGCPCTIFDSTVPANPTSGDTGSVELGMKFQADQNGTVTGVRFYKGTNNTGTHVGNLWTAGGTNLGTVTFTGETATGWQEASFASPIAVTAGITYVVSYHAPGGGYAFENNGLSSAIANGPLTALASGSSGGNGVYAYGSGGFPSNSYQASNYFVDVVFQPA